MGRKQKERIQQLQDDLEMADRDYQDLARDYNQKCYELFNQNKTHSAVTTKKKEYAGSVAFDFWPLTDWTRLRFDKWSPGRAAQLTVGPVRVDFYES